MSSRIQEKSNALANGIDAPWTPLVKKAKAGSRSAFAELVDLFQDDIFKMVFYRTRTQMDAEDITQEVFMQLKAGFFLLRSIGFAIFFGKSVSDRFFNHLMPVMILSHWIPKPTINLKLLMNS